MKLTLFVVLSALALAVPPLAAPSKDDEFLTIEEYQSHLWKNPRGIGCNSCHGKAGEEVVFAHFVQDNVKKAIIIPSIQNTSWADFYAALKGKSTVKNIMPDYHLTDKEISNLYLYIKGAKNDK